MSFYHGLWLPSWDDSFNPCDPKLMRGHGFRLVFGYAGVQSTKVMTPARVDDIEAAGVGIGALFEARADRALTAGHLGGAADGRAARAAWTKLGYPESLPIVYAVDVNVSPAQISGPLANYFDGVGHGDPVRPWIYGENDAIEYLYAHGLVGGGYESAAYLWGLPPAPLTLADAAAHAAAVQLHNGVHIAGGTADLGYVRADAPFWWPRSHPSPLPVYAPGSRTLVYSPGKAQMIGTDVEALQRFLQPDTSPASWVDGIYGPATAERVSWYEGMKGITQETPYGIAGPQVWKATGLH